MIKNENYYSSDKIKEILFAEYFKKIGSLIKNKQIDCFFSYAWGDDEHKTRIHTLQKCLSYAGVKVWFDLKDNSRLGSDISDFIEKISKVQYVVLFYSLNLIKKLKEETIIKREIEHIINSWRYCKSKDTSLLNEVDTSATLRGFSCANIDFIRQKRDIGAGSFGTTTFNSKYGDYVLSPPGSPISSLRYYKSKGTSLFDSTTYGTVSGDSISSPPISLDKKLLIKLK